MSRRLLTIPISHYCEKARWALDRAGLDYVEERHVQGVAPVYGVTLPQPDRLPQAVASDVGRFREHPAGAFALRLIRDHRR